MFSFTNSFIFAENWLELSEEYKFPSPNYDLNVDVNAI